MSKVEELRNEVVISCDPWQRDSVIRVLDSLIAAARAEGAEQEREKIREQGEFILKQDAPFASDVDLYIIPASLLAPAPKEGK